MSRRSNFLKDLSRVVLSTTNFRQQDLAAELADKRGTTSNLEAPISDHLAGKREGSGVLAGVELIYLDRVAPREIPHSYMQRLLDAQDAADRASSHSGKASERTAINLFLERGAYLDEVSDLAYAQASAMRQLLEGFDASLRQMYKNKDPEVRKSLTAANEIEASVSKLFKAIEKFRAPPAGGTHPTVNGYFFMSYAGYLILWLISELPSESEAAAQLAQTTHARLHSSGALQAMRIVATEYQCGDWVRLFNLAHALEAVFTSLQQNEAVLNSTAILDEAVRTYKTAVELNPRLSSFDEAALNDGIDEPIRVSKGLAYTITRLERIHPHLLAEAREAFRRFRDEYKDSQSKGIKAMIAHMKKTNRRQRIDSRKLRGAVLPAALLVVLSWATFNQPFANNVDSRPSAKTLLMATKPIFPAMAHIKPIFPFDDMQVG